MSYNCCSSLTSTVTPLTIIVHSLNEAAKCWCEENVPYAKDYVAQSLLALIHKEVKLSGKYFPCMCE